MFRRRKRHLKVLSMALALPASGLLIFSSGALADHKSHHNPGGGGGDPDSPSFVVVDLGRGSASAVNDVLNGVAEVVGGVDRRATYWEINELGNAQAVFLPEPVGGVESYTSDLNNFGEVVGFANVQDTNGVFATATLSRFINGSWTVLELPTLPRWKHDCRLLSPIPRSLVGRVQGMIVIAALPRPK